jgi:hypothetical protein
VPAMCGSDPRSGLAEVDHGSGGLTLVDPAWRAQIAYQLSRASGGIPDRSSNWSSLRDPHQIAVVELDARRLVLTWPMREARASFPLALGHSQPLIVSVFRSPPTLLLLDLFRSSQRSFSGLRCVLSNNLPDAEGEAWLPVNGLLRLQCLGLAAIGTLRLLSSRRMATIKAERDIAAERIHPTATRR